MSEKVLIRRDEGGSMFKHPRMEQERWGEYEGSTKKFLALLNIELFILQDYLPFVKLLCSTTEEEK